MWYAAGADAMNSNAGEQKIRTVRSDTGNEIRTGGDPCKEKNHFDKRSFFGDSSVDPPVNGWSYILIRRGKRAHSELEALHDA